MRPSRRLFFLLAVLGGLALVLALWRLFAPQSYSNALAGLWWLSLALLAIVAVSDARAGRQNLLSATRLLPGSFAVGVPNKVELHLRNLSGRALHLQVFDHHPASVEVEGLPVSFMLGPDRDLQLNYLAKPRQRGDVFFRHIDVRISSALGLWEYRRQFPAADKVKVYPNFTAITHFQHLSNEQQVSQLGLHMLQRRGQGMDFHQLREYRDGDVSRQIDWKASARRRKLISRDYQDERDQEIIFLLDCGRRMRTKEAGLSHFDHCLNSLLLLSYVALRQGDSVGLLSFAGTQRWMPPIKGKNKINTILNTVYDMDSGTATSDLLEGAVQLMARHRKRCLVILLSNFREEDRDDVVAASRLLSRKHLLLIANLRETLLDSILDTPVSSFESSLAYSTTAGLLNKRRRLVQSLRNSGILVSDTTPADLPMHLVNQYWALKRSGRI